MLNSYLCKAVVCELGLTMKKMSKLLWKITLDFLREHIPPIK